MCFVSNVSDHFYDKWNTYPRIGPPSPAPWVQPDIDWDKLPFFKPAPSSPLTQEEIDLFRDLMKKAKDIDVATNQPNCELKEKQDRLRKLAEELGVKINFD